MDYTQGEEKMGTLYTRLTSITGEMSPESIEHHIARVMLEHIHQLNDISIGSMAGLCSVSKSTISKFVKQLGFEDYKEFKAEAYSRGKREVYIKDLNTINITDYILQNGTEQYLDVLFSDIRDLFYKIDFKKIEQLVTMIHDYEEVAAFGEGYSETAALNFQHKMSFYQKFIYTTTNDRKQVKYIIQAKENTLLLIFSNSGRYISEYTNLKDTPSKKCFEETKAKVVLFTSNHKMEKDARVDLCINWEYKDLVQNHPILYQLLIEQIAIAYQKKYGFPMEKICD